jgi:lysozyme family protein
MEANFIKSLAWVRVSEGGNDDDPDDHGGRTSRGITQREYNAYCEIAGVPAGDVWQAPDAIVNDIYHRAYWMPYCPVMPPGVDYVFFDEAVNTGPHEAVIMLQVGLGFMGRDVDGHLGVITSAALIKAKPAVLIDKMSDYRVLYYHEIEVKRPVDRKYDKGWMARVEFCQKNAHTLVAGNGTHS